MYYICLNINTIVRRRSFRLPPPLDVPLSKIRRMSMMQLGGLSKKKDDSTSAVARTPRRPYWAAGKNSSEYYRVALHMHINMAIFDYKPE